MISFNQFILELADESRREFLKKLGKGVAMATSGLKPDLSAVKKVAKVSSIPYPVIGHGEYDRDFDSYDALSFALDNMFEFGRAESNLSMPLKLQQQLGNKLQHMIIGHKFASVPGGPSSLRPTDYNFYSDLMDNADEYGDMDEAIASTSATLQDVFDYKKIFKGADSIWKKKGMVGLDDLEKYIKDNVEGYINADKEGDTGYEGEPEPVDEDPRDYLERDYASGPHMNSFKPEMSFNQFYLSEAGQPPVQLDDDIIKQKHAEGKTADDIAIELDVSTRTIYRRAEVLGLEFKPDLSTQFQVGTQHLVKQVDTELIRQRHAEGGNAEEIGKELSVSGETIRRRGKTMDPPLMFPRTGGPRPLKKGSHKGTTSRPSQRTRNITGPGNVGAAHQEFPGSSHTIKSKPPGPRGGKIH